MKIQKFVFNPFGANTYLIYDESNEGIIIDPGCYTQQEQEQFKSFISENNIQPVRVLNTHGHPDHIFGNGFIQRTYGLSPEMHKDEEVMAQNAGPFAEANGLSLETIPPVSRYLNENDIIRFGNSQLKIFEIPGHSPGSLVFYNEESKIIVSGDVLFNGGIGRTDLPGGDYNQLIEGITNKLLTLPGDFNVFPGHGNETTIDAEKKSNMFLQ